MGETEPPRSGGPPGGSPTSGWRQHLLRLRRVPNLRADGVNCTEILIRSERSFGRPPHLPAFDISLHTVRFPKTDSSEEIAPRVGLAKAFVSRMMAMNGRPPRHGPRPDADWAALPATDVPFLLSLAVCLRQASPTHLSMVIQCPPQDPRLDPTTRSLPMLCCAEILTMGSRCRRQPNLEWRCLQPASIFQSRRHPLGV